MNNFFFNIKVLINFWGILSSKKFLLNKSVFEFEKKISDYFELKYSLGVASGTDALMLSLKVAGVEPGDEVIVPALSFYSTAGAVTWVGATPVFVDVSLPDFSINSFLIEQKITAKTKVIVVAHLNGIVSDISFIKKIAKKNNLLVIEDYAQSFGAFYLYNGAKSYGDIVCLSLNAKKIFHGGGDGGVILTNNKIFFEKIKLMRMYGAKVEDFGRDHSIQGIASRLGVWNASILNIHYNYIEKTLSVRRKNYFNYLNLLDSLRGKLFLPKFTCDKKMVISGYRFVILTERRDELFSYLKRHNVNVQINYRTALPFMTAFSHSGYSSGDFPVAERIARESLTLPTEDFLTNRDIHKISNLIIFFFTKS
jgi:dTDP-4-amino-4,6-dideoxygalactose transaminase